MAVAERKELARVDQPVVPVALVPQHATETTPATVSPAEEQASMFERLVRDPTVDVDKLERLIAMQERIQARNARSEYYADFARMQGDLPTVIERGQTNNGRYATHEDIVEAVRPVLQRHGFMLSFRTKFDDKLVKVTGVLAHRSGHAEETEFVSSPDVSGNKNAIQALGSAQSYGQRYTARALLNIASRQDDDDGRKAHGQKTADAPPGFDEWWTNLTAVADNGTIAMEKMWRDSNNNPKTKACLAYASQHRAKALNDLKAKAARVAAQ